MSIDFLPEIADQTRPRPNSADVMIEVSGVGKTYHFKDKPFSTFRKLMGAQQEDPKAAHNALDDINITIRKGDTVGLLGVNGAGKSTLLQIITGTLPPTRGKVRTVGSISALLQLGAGFNPEWTGRANAEFQCILQGIPASQLEKTMRSIEEFADIGAYFDQPTRTYSSGMFLRVAFASAVATEPDILIVDEALAVGDVRFQNKCFHRFEQMQANGCTILFVTHSPDMVSRFCNRGIVLDAGKLVFDGSADQAVREYMLIMMGTRDQVEQAASASVVEPPADNAAQAKEAAAVPTIGSTTETQDARSLAPSGIAAKVETVDAERMNKLMDRVEKRYRYNPEEIRSGKGKARIMDAFFHLGDFKEFVGAFEPGSEVCLTVRIDYSGPVRCPEYGMVFRTVSSQIITGATNWIVSEHMTDVAGPCTVYMTWRFKMNFLVGTYFLDLGVSEMNKDARKVQDSRQSICRIDVKYTTKCFGTTFVDCTFGDVIVTAPKQSGA